MSRYGSIGPYNIAWKFSDNRESIHVHAYYNKQECGKFWLSKERNAIIIEYCPKDLDVGKVAELILNDPTYSRITQDWLNSLNNKPFTYIDGRKYNGKYYYVEFDKLMIFNNGDYIP